MLKIFFGSVILGFLTAVAGFVYFMGPETLRDQVCQGYSTTAKPLAIARAEKSNTNYIAQHQNKSKTRTQVLARPSKSALVSTPLVKSPSVKLKKSAKRSLRVKKKTPSERFALVALAFVGVIFGPSHRLGFHVE